MKNIKHIFFILALSNVFYTCGQNTSSPTTKSIETLWDEMMVIHDEVMPKMSDISRLKKQLRGNSANLQLITNLTKAEDGMWNWMHNLQPLSKVETMTITEAKTYLLAETAKIQQVSNLMKTSIRDAQERIRQISGQ